MVPVWEFNSLKKLSQFLNIPQEGINKELFEAVQIDPLAKTLFIHYVISFIVDKVNTEKLFSMELPKSIDIAEKQPFRDEAGSISVYNNGQLLEYNHEKVTISNVEFHGPGPFKVVDRSLKPQGLDHYFDSTSLSTAKPDGLKSIFTYDKGIDYYLTVRTYDPVSNERNYARMMGKKLYDAIIGREITDFVQSRSKTLKEYTGHFKAFNSFFENSQRQVRVAIIGTNEPTSRSKYKVSQKTVLEHILHTLNGESDAFEQLFEKPEQDKMLASKLKNWKVMCSMILNLDHNNP
ncbi:MAG: hypothetical protein IH840_17625 [Candidatus Heimdallarchaeota archaeon]|nr:hypothetical protein [Candidatus Heimdallarchaeota archaeon]